MSIILDALRKSESARLSEAEAHHAGVPRARARAGMPWWIWAVAALLVANLALLGWLLNRPSASAPTLPTGPAAAVQDLDRVALAGKESVGAVAARQAAPGAMPAPGRGEATTRRTPEVPPAQYPVRASDEGGSSELGAAAAAAIEAESEGVVTGASSAPPTPAVRPAPASAPSRNDTDLTTSPPAGLAPLEVSLHYYDGPGGRSFVTINGHTARAGTVLPEGPLVEQVTLEGAILNYRGQRFLLPRN